MTRLFFWLLSGRLEVSVFWEGDFLKHCRGVHGDGALTQL